MNPLKPGVRNTCLCNYILKFKIYLIYCQISRYHFRKIATAFVELFEEGLNVI